VKKILYPTKHEELVKLHGIELGEKEYNKFLKTCSLEKYILKYGRDEGENRYNNLVLERSKKIRGNRLDKFIRDHGEEIGRTMYEDWKLKTSQSLDGFIRRYGEEEGKIRFENFRKKNTINLSKATLNRKNFNTRLEYWVNKYGEEEGKQKYIERQNTSSLNKLIKRYGEEEGKQKYIEINESKNLSLENFIRRYGNERGIELYEKNIEVRKFVRSKEYRINKYGEEKYREMITKSTKNNTKVSIIGLNFCLLIEDMIDKNKVKTYYGENEYIFYTGDKNQKLICPDFYIKGNNISIVIEFYGDYWHKNPVKYDETEEVKRVWEKDKNRVNLLKENFNCDCHVIWERDFKKNKQVVLNKFKEIFKKYGIYRYTGS